MSEWRRTARKRKFPKISFEDDAAAGNLLYQSPYASYLSFFPRSLNSSVCLRRRVYTMYTRYVRGSTRVTLTMLHGELAEPRDIRGSQFIFPADSSKNLLRLVCRRPDALRTFSPQRHPSYNSCAVFLFFSFDKSLFIEDIGIR